MDAKKVALSALIVLFLLTSAFSQNVELTGYVGGQVNGGLLPLDFAISSH